MRRLSNKMKDLTNQRFGRLTVLGLDPNYDKDRRTYWICQCDCGAIKSCRGDCLQGGAIQSCGCLKKEQDSKNLDRTTHGGSRTRIYDIWKGMILRCEDKDSRWGGRGIKVCDEWKDFSTFRDWALSNGYRDDLTIDRKDNDGDYTPENCRWTDALHQARNRSTNIDIRIGNSVRCLTEWCEIFDLDYGIVWHRYHEGYDTDKLFKPTQGRYRGNQQDQLTP